MKKIIISFLVALLFIQNAMADCKIKNQPSEELKAYIKDFETMMKNISSYSAPKKERSIYDFWVGLSSNLAVNQLKFQNKESM